MPKALGFGIAELGKFDDDGVLVAALQIASRKLYIFSGTIQAAP